MEKETAYDDMMMKAVDAVCMMIYSYLFYKSYEDGNNAQIK